MKREYVKPVMESEEFVANEYVAACYKGLGGLSCDIHARDCEVFTSNVLEQNGGKFSSESSRIEFALEEFFINTLEKIYGSGNYKFLSVDSPGSMGPDGGASICYYSGKDYDYYHEVSYENIVTVDDVTNVTS